MNPTMELRWKIEKKLVYTGLHGEQETKEISILQQKWIDRDEATGLYIEEWRDVPIVEEPEKLNMYDLEGRN